MTHEGPALESLLHRLAETPDDFLEEPRIVTSGKIQVAAVIHDLLIALGKPVPLADLAPFQSKDAAQDRNRLSISLLLAWLFFDPWFFQQKDQPLLQALQETASELAPFVNSRRFVEDPDRREELARFALARLDLRPFGESIAQAQDRLTTISTAERNRVVKAARAAEERARAIRAELARKAAEESADKYTRE